MHSPDHDPASPLARPGLARAYALVRLALGLIFVAAGVLKLAEPRAFAQVIAGYGLLPGGTAGLAALVLPALEILAGTALILNMKGGLAGVAGMLALFMAVLAYGMHLGLDVDCGCFAPGDPEAEAYHGLGAALARDGAMLAACAFLYFCRRTLGLTPVWPGDFAHKRFTRNKETPSCVR